MHNLVECAAMARPPSQVREDAPEVVGARLRLLRIAKMGDGQGAQAAFCKMVNIEPPTWNNYEAGYSRIALDQALKLCASVGVSLDWIYRGIESTNPVSLMQDIRRAAEASGVARRGRERNHSA
jgi:transcriptional regulator with XRE-family HTH domain